MAAIGGVNPQTGQVDSGASWVGAKNQTYPSWEYAFLTAIRAPSNTKNLAALNLWAQSEGTPSNQNNWLAYGDSSTHITKYASPGEGVTAITTALLSNPQYGYNKIVAAFQDPNGNMEDIWKAINESSWCKGCEGGSYPTALYSNLSTSPELIAIKNNTGTSGPGGIQVGAGCNKGQEVWGIPIIGTIINQCQAKAIKGGFITAFGFAIVAGGIAILVTGSVQRLELQGLARQIGAPTVKLSKRLFGTTPTSEPQEAVASSPKTKTTVTERRAQDREKNLADAEASIAQRERENRAYYGNKTTRTTTVGTKASQARSRVRTAPSTKA